MKKLLKNTFFQIILGLIVMVLITWGAINLLSKHPENYSSTTVTRRDLSEVVNATGSVLANQEVTLAFSMQGKVAAVYADVGSTTSAGEVLAALDSGTLQAQLSGAEADVSIAEANLATIKRGARPEELALYQQKYKDASSALSSAMKSAYLSIEDAIVNKSDTLFTNGDSANPVLNIPTQNQIDSINIQNERVALKDKLTTLKNNLTIDSLDLARTTTSDTLSIAKTYLDHLALITNSLALGNSGLSQTDINTDRAIVNTASQEIVGAISIEQGIDAAWSSARDSLTLEQAGSTSESIQAGQAALDKALATVAGLQSQINQSYIISPFDGLITDMNIKVGEVYVPGISATEGINLISNGSYKIEVYVPETDIGKINVGNPVTVTFDAYGPNTPFDAKVSLVDPAETIQNGVNAYKVTITFDNSSDNRIKSGLTSNVIINTKNDKAVLAVPSRAIITHGLDKFVMVKQGVSDNYVEQKINTGIESADGYTEIISGLHEGDVIASFGIY